MLIVDVVAVCIDDDTGLVVEVFLAVAPPLVAPPPVAPPAVAPPAVAPDGELDEGLLIEEGLAVLPPIAVLDEPEPGPAAEAVLGLAETTPQAVKVCPISRVFQSTVGLRADSWSKLLHPTSGAIL